MFIRGSEVMKMAVTSALCGLSFDLHPPGTTRSFLSPLTTVARPGTIALQHAGPAVEYADMRRWAEVADPHLQRGLQLQEHDLKWLFLQSWCEARAVYPE